jgi:endogenous inhibitor of DNA gyrase (YacG/DUF329 family)
MIYCPKCQTPFNPTGKWGLKKFCSKKCANSRTRSDAFKKHARKLALAKPSGWAATSFNRKKVGTENGNYKKWLNLRSTVNCKECSVLFEVAYSKRHRKYCSVLCSNKNKYHLNSNRKKISLYKGYRMDSGAELIFAKECDKLNINWHKNTITFFPFVDSTGKASKYYPDFYLPTYDCWVEIKGRRYIRTDDSLRRASVDKPIYLIMSNQFKKDFDSVLHQLTGG